MKVNSQLLLKNQLDETLCISKLMILRSRIFIIKSEMEQQLIKANKLNDAKSLETITENLFFISKNLRTVDLVITNKNNEITILGEYHNNCLN